MRACDEVDKPCERRLTIGVLVTAQQGVEPGRGPIPRFVFETGDLERLGVQYAAQMTLRVRVDDAVFDALRRHFDTTGLVELTSAIATYNMVARFLVALGVSPET